MDGVTRQGEDKQKAEHKMRIQRVDFSIVSQKKPSSGSVRRIRGLF